MNKIKKKDIASILSQWQQKFNVYVPSKADGVAKMAEWDGEDTGFLDWYRNTVIPPKANFLPNMEKMFDFSKCAGEYNLEQSAADTQKQLFFNCL